MIAIQHPLPVGETVAFRRGSLTYAGKIEDRTRFEASSIWCYRVRVLSRSGSRGGYSVDVHDGQIERVLA